MKFDVKKYQITSKIDMDSSSEDADNPNSDQMRERFVVVDICLFFYALHSRLKEDVRNWVSINKRNIEDAYEDVISKINALYETTKFSNDFDVEFVRSEILSVLTKDIGQLKVTKRTLKTVFPNPKLLKLKVGASCFAKWSEDGVFYNAIIQNINGDDTVEVLFIDYGNVDNVRLDEVVLHRHEIPIDAALDENIIDVKIELVQEEDADVPTPVKIENTNVSDEEKRIYLSASAIKDELSFSATTGTETALWPVGANCFAKWSDSVWYNAQILENYPDSSSVSVMFTDYGNEDIVSIDFVKDNVQQIPLEDLLDENIPKDDINILTNDRLDRISKIVSEDEIDKKCKTTSELVINGLNYHHETELCIEESSLFNKVETESSLSTNVTTFSLKEGDKCVARWTDEVWYNAEVVSRDPIGFIVRFTDYGNEDLVPSNFVLTDKTHIPPLEPLDEHLLENLPTIENVSLEDFKPNSYNSSNFSDCRNTRLLEKFESLVPNHLQCSLCGLVAKRCMNLICDEFVDFPVCWGCGVKKINTDRKCWICKKVNISSEEHLVKNLALRRFIDQVSIANEPLPAIDEESNVVVENRDFAQHDLNVRQDEESNIAVEDSFNVDEVLLDHNQNHEVIGKVDSKFHVGEKCFAKWVDEVFYNAEVQKINEDNTLSVLFTDYGNIDEVVQEFIVKTVNDIPKCYDLDVNIYEGTDIIEAEDVVVPPIIDDHVEISNQGSGDSGLSLGTSSNFLTISRPLKTNVVLDDLNGPVGVSILHDNTLAVVCRNSNTVLKLSRDGDHLRTIKSRRPFSRPTDIFVMDSGEFIIRDSVGLQIFSKDGLNANTIGEKHANNYIGVTEDEEHIITINRNTASIRSRGKLTKHGETDLFFFDKKTKELVKRVELVDVIEAANTDPQKSSACGSLFYDSNSKKLFITDSVLNQVYCLYHHNGEEGAGVFGTGYMSKPSGIVMDDQGSIMIVDTGSNRLLVVDKDWNFRGYLKVNI